MKLVFFTTNRTKLAHLRYIAEDKPILIESFRRKTYYASYKEPRITDRAELLQQSYNSALEQAENSGINIEKTFFILEDTSVRIEALSTENDEVPGVDIKYWMKENDFSKVNALLKQKGNNRAVTVRSDILLHIPKHYRTQCNTSESYVIFIGQQKGNIINEELEFKTNLLYPWLDNKSFNKWFVPDGADKPISLLPIKEANKFDFREKAFSQLVNFLNKAQLLVPALRQNTLLLDTTPLLVVCGFPCAGKTTISQFLFKEFDYLHIEASDFMYLSYYQLHGLKPNISISDFAEYALSERPEIAVSKIVEYMSTLPKSNFVISGFRSLEEILWLKNYFSQSKNIAVSYIQASEKIRHERYNTRKRDKEISLAKFKEKDKQQIRMGLDKIESYQPKFEILNEHTKEQFYSDFVSIIFQDSPLTSVPKDELDFISLAQSCPIPKLEEAIFTALLHEWNDGEDRPYYTTTQIARLINKIFPDANKHKDNVSRNFTQDFYPFFEIKTDDDENKARYRLSNTGYGRALLFYKKMMQAES